MSLRDRSLHVLPLSTKGRLEADLFAQPMPFECLLCGELPASHGVHDPPMPKVDCKQGKRWVVSGMLCRACFLAYPDDALEVWAPQQLHAWTREWIVVVRPHPEWLAHGERLANQLASLAHRSLDALQPHDKQMLLERVGPSVYDLDKFGGTFPWSSYYEKAFASVPRPPNPWLAYLYERARPIYRKSERAAWEARGCWGCRLRFTAEDLEQEGVLPAVLDTHASDPEEPSTLIGFFHGDGRCAVRFLHQYGGDKRTARLRASAALWVRDYGMSEKQAAFALHHPACDPQLLASRGGVFTRDVYRVHTSARLVAGWNYPVFTTTRSDGRETLVHAEVGAVERCLGDDDWVEPVTAVQHPLSDGHTLEVALLLAEAST